MDLPAEYTRAVEPCLRGPIAWGQAESVPGAPVEAKAVSYMGHVGEGTRIVIVRWAAGGTARYDGTLTADLLVVHLIPVHAILLGIRAEAEAPVPVTKS